MSSVVLPMGTLPALWVLLQGISMVEAIFHWWNVSFLNGVATEKIKAKYEPALVDFTNKSVNVTTAGERFVMIADLLFGNPSSVESKSTPEVSVREFLTLTKQLLFNSFSKAPNTSASEVQVEFAHTENIAARATFDSLTIEIPLRKDHFSREIYYSNSSGSPQERRSTSASGDGNFYYDLNPGVDCSRDACRMRKPEYDFSGNVFCIKPQIHALTTCLNADETEDPMLRFKYWSDLRTKNDSRLGRPDFFCQEKSNTSMFTVSVGERIQGDEIATRNSSTDNRQLLRLTNVRKVYSITVTLISWELQDLTTNYNAKCLGDGDATLRLGLWHQLETPDDQSSKPQHLVVSAKRLPLPLLTPNYSFGTNLVGYLDSTGFTRLVSKLLRQPSDPSSIERDSVSDLVYPRRFLKTKWSPESNANTTKCSAKVEDFLNRMESNHLYMEKTLQPSIAADFFFLFQDAVVRDVIPSSTDSRSAMIPSSSVMLEFLGNIQWIDVNLSSLMPNIVMTLVGAALLLLTSVAIGIVDGKEKEAKFQRLMTAHNVAELLIDEKKYPSFLMGKMILAAAEQDLQTPQLQEAENAAPKSATEAETLNQFRIQSLTLVNQADGQQIVLSLDEARDYLKNAGDSV